MKPSLYRRPRGSGLRGLDPVAAVALCTALAFAAACGGTDVALDRASEDGAAGLARYQSERYTAVITDFLMPGMDGFEVVAALRTIDPHVRVIMLTGSAAEMTVGRARESGVTLLHKPIALQELKAAVDAACQA